MGRSTPYPQHAYEGSSNATVERGLTNSGDKASAFFSECATKAETLLDRSASFAVKDTA